MSVNKTGTNECPGAGATRRAGVVRLSEAQVADDGTEREIIG